MDHIKALIEKCSSNHILSIAYLKYGKMIYIKSFLLHLNQALDLLYSINKPAYKDFINNKLKAADGDGFSFHGLISAICELSIINSFLSQSDRVDSFRYEPNLRSDNMKNVEFSISIKGIIYNIEVKSPNLNNYYEQLSDKLKRNEVVTRYDTRAFGKPQKDNEIGSPTMRVKDFLCDANNKFPISTFPNQVNILFIAWDDNTDQPCIELKNPIHGLLTNNSWYRDDTGKPVLFPNIDLVFISDLYQNIIAHISSGNTPLPMFLTGVPYFERNARFPQEKINPFILSYSRNVLIKPDFDLSDERVGKSIFNLPIAFSDQSVIVVDEAYIQKHGIDVKFSWQL